MPTHSQASERAVRRLCRWIGAVALCAVPAVVLAHAVADVQIPETPGWRVGAAVAVSAIGARDTLPAPYLFGVLDTGQAAPSRNGLTLEHATLEGGLRIDDWLGANLAVGWHAGENIHLEAAWLQARWWLDEARLSVGAGRAKVPMGAVLDGGGDYDRFTLVPLVKRASLNVDWFDEGVVVAWQGDAASPISRVEAGLWRGSGFPGGGELPPVPALHVQALVAEVTLDAFAAWLQPTGRGTYALDSGSPGHSHGVPNCANSLSGLVCFDGKVQVYGGSVAWAPHGLPLSITLAALLRNEQGSLYSQLGDARYRGQTLGGWLDVVWQVQPQWTLAGRFEALRATQDLEGPGASLVAAQARLIPNLPAYRAAAALAYSATSEWGFNIEIGAERNGGIDNPYVGARVVWWAPGLLSGRW